jgi:hypothetical protein
VDHGKVDEVGPAVLIPEQRDERIAFLGRAILLVLYTQGLAGIVGHRGRVRRHGGA